MCALSLRAAPLPASCQPLLPPLTCRAGHGLFAGGASEREGGALQPARAAPAAGEGHLQVRGRLGWLAVGGSQERPGAAQHFALMAHTAAAALYSRHPSNPASAHLLFMCLSLLAAGSATTGTPCRQAMPSGELPCRHLWGTGRRVPGHAVTQRLGNFNRLAWLCKWAPPLLTAPACFSDLQDGAVCAAVVCSAGHAGEPVYPVQGGRQRATTSRKRGHEDSALGQAAVS